MESPVNVSKTLVYLRYSAVAAVAFGVAQLALGGYLIFAPGELNRIHEAVGTLSLVATVVAAGISRSWQKEGGNPGLRYHTAGMFLVGIAQYLLGTFMVRDVHIAVGVFYVIGLIALVALTYRKPFASGENETPAT